MIRRHGFGWILVLAAALGIPAAAGAVPILPIGIEGLSIVVAGSGPVIATFHGSSTEYVTDLYLALDGLERPACDGNPRNDCFLFNSRDSKVGSQVNLGSFDAGTVLTFRLFVRNTSESFYSGPGSLNPDGAAHARVEEGWTAGESLVLFEDRFDAPERGGDFDYDDLMFSFTNSAPAVAEPWSLTLFAVGLTCLVNAARARR